MFITLHNNNVVYQQLRWQGTDAGEFIPYENKKPFAKRRRRVTVAPVHPHSIVSISVSQAKHHHMTLADSLFTIPGILCAGKSAVTYGDKAAHIYSIESDDCSGGTNAGQDRSLVRIYLVSMLA